MIKLCAAATGNSAMVPGIRSQWKGAGHYRHGANRHPRMPNGLSGIRDEGACFSPRQSREKIEASGGTQVSSLSEILKDADFVSLHVPLDTGDQDDDH